MPRLHLFLFALLLAACNRAPEGPRPGEMITSWDGAFRGTIRMEAQATLCAQDSILELFGYRADIGAGLAIHADSAAPRVGTLAVLSPLLEVIPRPAATGAFRILTTDALATFTSRSGSVEVTESGPEGISGRFALGLAASSGTDTLAVRAVFHRVRIAPAFVPCGSGSRPDSAGA